MDQSKIFILMKSKIFTFIITMLIMVCLNVSAGINSAVMVDNNNNITYPTSPIIGNGVNITNVNLSYTYENFIGKPNGSLVGSLTDNGLPWVNYWVNGNGTNAIITNNVMTTPPTSGNGVWATYASIYSPKDVVRMWADISFNANYVTNTLTASGAFLLGLTATNPGSFTTDMHLYIGPTQMSWGAISNGSIIAAAGSPIYTWSPAFLAKGWGTNTYHIDIYRYNGFGIVLGPDGIYYKIVNTNWVIGTIANNYPTWEPYQNNSHTELLPQFSNIGCSTAYSNQVSPSANDQAITLMNQQGNMLTANIGSTFGVGVPAPVNNGQAFEIECPGQTTYFTMDWVGHNQFLSWNGGPSPSEFYDALLTGGSTWSGGLSGDTLTTSGGITIGTYITGPTNSVAPGNTSTIKAWVNYTNSTGGVFKMPLYQ
jgi:hypothetical protein